MATAQIERMNDGSHRIVVDTLFREKYLIQQIPGAKFNANRRAWILPLSYSACTQLSNTFGKAIQPSPELVEWAQVQYVARQALETYKPHEHLTEDDCAVTPAGMVLKPWQESAARFILANRSVVLGDDMGTGKTLSFTSGLDRIAIQTGRDFRALVIAPASVLINWERTLTRHSDLQPYLIRGGAAKRRKLIEQFVDNGHPAVAIISWNGLIDHIQLKHYGNVQRSDKEKALKEFDAINFTAVVCDEAHRMKSPKTKWTRGAWNVKAEWRMVGTGTPIANHPGDYWSLLHMVDPEEWPSRSQYIDRYCAQAFSAYGSGTVITGLQHTTRQEFYSLTDAYFLRRTKEELGIATETIYEQRFVTLPPKQRKMYDDFKRELLARVEEGVISATNPLAATARLTQLAAATLRETEDGEYEMVMPSPKIDELEDLLGDIPADESVIVMSDSAQLIELAAAMLEKKDESYVRITGAVTGTDRDEAVDRFESRRVRIALVTTGAGGEGITLNAGRHMVFLTRPWSLVQNEQAEARNNRIGQEADSLVIYDIIAEDTIDERKFEVLVEKSTRLDEITRDSLKELLQ